MPRLSAKRPSRRKKPQKLDELKRKVREQKPRKRLNVDLDADFHDQLKIFAIQQKITVSELVKKALNEYMSK